TTFPFLQPLLPQDRILDICKTLVVNEPSDIVLPGEPANDLRPVLIYASHKIVGDADIKCSAKPAGENVNPIAPLSAHASWSLATVVIGDNQTNSLVNHRV